MAEIIDIGAVGDYSQLAGYGIMDAAGTSVPADGALGYGHGCIYRKANGTTGADAIYVNIGTKSSANFDILNPSYVPSVALRTYPIPMAAYRVWDAMATNLPGTAANDDLGLSTGTFGTSTVSLITRDCKAVGSNVVGYARVQVPVPPSYVAGEAISLVVTGYMVDGTPSQSAELDAQVYNTAAPTVDICATSAYDMLAVVAATDKTFTITPTNVSAGQLLDIRLSMAIDDTDGSGTTMVMAITKAVVKFTTLQ